ncbi:uncharacterized protein YndB with AHSA1/START domain [Brevibacterium sanguinis]|uniref:Uncharacterized protein YndB with AHSA1/START domain n=2 Tax=Brevibacterium TaxID=1696 RepID=A0A366IIB3_9MICO|nr:MULTISPECIES: SRPBCC domain-containing protein [Brevibacterium]RBP64157.1 uncharacterized protein YndB with AHSA1/START domain [Brevibacterium sanguinis]RBP71551.1 uncharacterized protein YndB with AHSA1/START domain [Brevibacterium celere]
MAPTPTGSRERHDDGDHLVLTRRIRAARAEVWAALTVPARTAVWIGTWTGDPRSGTVDVTMGFEGDGAEPQTFTIDDCQAPHRLAVTSAAPGAEGPDEVWHIEIDLVEAVSGDNAETELRFSQPLSDPAAAESIGPGWEYYIDRLAAAAVGTDVEAIDFADYFPAQSRYYRDLFTTRP